MELEIQLDYTIQDFAAFWHGFIKKRPQDPSPNAVPPKPVLAAGKFFCWFFLALGPLCIFNSLWQGESMRMEGEGLFIRIMNLGLTTPLGGVTAMAFGGLCLRQIRKDAQSPPDPTAPPYSRWVQKAWKQYQSNPSLRSCRFDGEGCWIYDARSDHRYDYEALENLWEDGGRFYLVLPGRPQRMYILPKRAFSTGAPEDLPALWRERTGKLVRTVE